MIPDDLWEEWLAVKDRLEVVFLADHGGGIPDCLVGPRLDPEDRIEILRRLGFRLRERYEMPGNGWDDFQPWARLTNGVAVNLAVGFVVMSTKGGWKT